MHEVRRLEWISAQQNSVVKHGVCLHMLVTWNMYVLTDQVEYVLIDIQWTNKGLELLLKLREMDGRKWRWETAMTGIHSGSDTDSTVLIVSEHNRMTLKLLFLSKKNALCYWLIERRAIRIRIVCQNRLTSSIKDHRYDLWGLSLQYTLYKYWQPSCTLCLTRNYRKRESYSNVVNLIQCPFVFL